MRLESAIRQAAQRIFVCHPANAAEEAPCARKILTTLARRAFRRPLVDDTEVDGLMAFYEQGRKEGDFETGIQQASGTHPGGSAIYLPDGR